MTINEAISRYMQMRPSTKLTRDMMVDHLSRLDHLVKANVIDTHEGGGGEFKGYSVETPLDTQLLIDEHFADIYSDWLDIHNELLVKDYNKYNNACAIYDKKYQEFEAYYNRTHMPVQTERKYF